MRPRDEKKKNETDLPLSGHHVDDETGEMRQPPLFLDNLSADHLAGCC
jgi:hypothetical protein